MSKELLLLSRIVIYFHTLILYPANPKTLVNWTHLSVDSLTSSTYTVVSSENRGNLISSIPSLTPFFSFPCLSCHLLGLSVALQLEMIAQSVLFLISKKILSKVLSFCVMFVIDFCRYSLSD